MSIRPADEKERRIIRGSGSWNDVVRADPDFIRDQCLIVEAGSGSGKTSVLVARMVALVRSGIPVSAIAAITFTRKAAGEMRVRFHESLQTTVDSIHSDPAFQQTTQKQKALHNEYECLTAALDAFDGMFVDTIHAFCQRILREYALDAGLPPDYEVSSDLDEENRRTMYWKQFMTDSLSGGNQWIERLDRAGLNAHELFGYFSERSMMSRMPLAHGLDTPPDLGPAMKAFDAFLEKLQAGLDRPGHVDELTELLRKARRARTARSLNRSADQAAWLEIADSLVSQDGSIKKIGVRTWSSHSTEIQELMRAIRSPADSSSDSHDVRSLPELVSRIIRPVLREWRQYVHNVAAAYVSEAVQGYAEHRRRIGTLRFDDLLTLTVDLLRGVPRAREQLSRRYRRILVDEFQDTDPLQAEILFLLTAMDRAETDWRKCRPQPGSLFIVGDSKQSIYRFRSADVRVFQAAIDQIRSTGGMELHLTSNFRSRPSICNFINRALEPQFAEFELPYQSSYEPLCGERTDAVPGVLQMRTAPVSRHSPLRIAEAEAPRIARIIRALHAGQSIPMVSDQADIRRFETGLESDRPGFGDFMILVRDRNRMQTYATALQDAGIPYVTAGAKALGKTRILATVLDLLDSIHHPVDTISRVAYFRGAGAGLSDADLFQFVNAGGKLTDLSDIPRSLPESLQERLASADRRWRAARWAVNNWPLSQALEWWTSVFGILAVVSGASDGVGEAGAFVKLLSHIRERETRGGHWTEITEELRRLRDGDYALESMMLGEGRGDAVQLLNIHQAKGLEARVVFLADPMQDPARSRRIISHVDRSDSMARLALPVRIGSGRWRQTAGEPVDWDVFEDEERKFEYAEYVRLQYVAATRACDLLIVSRYEGSEIRGIWHRLYPALASEQIPSIGVFREEQIVKECRDDGRLHTLKAKRASASRALVRGQTASWTESTPSSLSEKFLDTTTTVSGVATGSGRQFGNFIHSLFDDAISSREKPEHLHDDHHEALFLAHREGIPSDRIEDFVERSVSVLKQFRSSTIWDELSRSDRVFTETPFAYRICDGMNVELVNGKPDLVYRISGNWKIVDYKTDACDMKTLVSRYSEQVKRYAESWTHLTGGSVVSAGLWSTENARWVDIM